MSPSSSSSSSSSLFAHQGGSTYEEHAMEQSFLFAENLKDLKNLRSQLYSAAEYFEFSFTNGDHKKILVTTLKDYAVKALINTIDHLGSVCYKVNDLLDEKTDEVTGTKLRMLCMEQRIRTCQDYTDHQGLAQQTLMIATPKYHKHYILPVSKSMSEFGRRAVAAYQEMYQLEGDDDESKQFQDVVRATIRERHRALGKTRSLSPSTRGRSSSPSRSKMRFLSPSLHTGKLVASEKRRAVSSVPTSNQLTRTISLSCRPVSRTASFGRKHLSEPQKSASMRLHVGRSDGRDLEHSTSKHKSLLKSLLSRSKTRTDNILYGYLDEY